MQILINTFPHRVRKIGNGRSKYLDYRIRIIQNITKWTLGRMALRIGNIKTKDMLNVPNLDFGNIETVDSFNVPNLGFGNIKTIDSFNVPNLGFGIQKSHLVETLQNKRNTPHYILILETIWLLPIAELREYYNARIQFSTESNHTNFANRIRELLEQAKKNGRNY